MRVIFLNTLLYILILYILLIFGLIFTLMAKHFSSLLSLMMTESWSKRRPLFPLIFTSNCFKEPLLIIPLTVTIRATKIKRFLSYHYHRCAAELFSLLLASITILMLAMEGNLSEKR